MISIRKKQTKKGIALYLDVYHNKKREWIHTNLFLTGDKKQDSIILKKAEIIKAEKTIEYENSNYSNINSGKHDFIEYVAMICKENPAYIRRINILNTLKRYTYTIKIDNINETFWNSYKLYLEKLNYKESTIYLHLKLLKSFLNRAVRDNIITKNPLQLVKGKKIKGNRQYLEYDEIVKLYNTDCINENVKKAFLFACYTGLRLSDIISLTDKSIVNGNIVIKQQKTKEIVTIPLSETAEKMIVNETGKLFILPAKSTMSIIIRQWVQNAGVNKHITFHCSRHTFATLSLTNDVDIETISKLLGHNDIRTTQIYAKIVDEKKRKAIDKLPSL